MGPGMTDNFRGAVLMTVSMAAFTINDTQMKLLAGEIPLFQLLFLRGVLTTVLTFFLALRMGALLRRLPRRDWGFVALRTVAEVAAAYFFLTALFNMPIANVTAILQALPLTVTLAAAVFLGVPVGWRRWSAILVGLAGVLLILRPGPEGFDIYSVYALIAVACVTLRDLATRQLSAATPSLLVTFATSFAIMTFFGLASLGIDWVAMDARSSALTAGAAAMVIAGYLCSIMVMRVGDISFVAPFRYTGLIWALVLGWLVFGEWPRPLTLLGAAIVVGSGLFMLYREHRLNVARLAMRKAL